MVCHLELIRIRTKIKIIFTFKFCSISKNSKILNYEHNCQLLDTNPVYKTKNFTILEKRQHMIDGEIHVCWAETIWVRSWRRWFLFPAEERLTPHKNKNKYYFYVLNFLFNQNSLAF